MGGTSAGCTTDNFLMFRGVELPFRTTVLSAFLRFDFHGELNKSAAITTAITAKDAQSPSLPTDCTPGSPPCCRGDTASWGPRTTAAGTWTGADVPNGLAQGDPFETVDIAAVIQELVDAWDYSGPGGADMLVFVHSTGAGVNQNVRWKAFDAAGFDPPLLHVEYTGGQVFSPGPRQSFLLVG